MSDNTDNQIERVRLFAIDFRKAIDRALEAGELFRIAIALFSLGCCGFTSDLLQRFLDENGINTRYVSGVYRDSRGAVSQPHA